MQQEIDFNNINTFELDDHLVLLMNGANRIQLLNPISKYIWNACSDGITPETTATEIANHFDIPLELAMQDVQMAITQWSLELSEADSPEVESPPEPIAPDLPDTWLPETETVFAFPRFTLRIRFDSQDIANLVVSMLAHIKTISLDQTDHVIDVIANNNRYFIIADGKLGETTDSAESAAVMAFREIAKLHCTREDWLVVLHAAGVAWKNDGIIFPAASGSGKTTLAAALVQRGSHYINDDIIPVERSTGRLIPLPISLCIKSGSWEPLQPYYPELAELRSYGRYNAEVKFLHPLHDKYSQPDYPARYLIIPRYGPDSDHRLEDISPVEGLQAIIEGNSRLRQPLKAEEIRELTNWVGKLRCYRLSYNDLNAAIATVTKLVSGDSKE